MCPALFLLCPLVSSGSRADLDSCFLALEELLPAVFNDLMSVVLSSRGRRVYGQWRGE